MKKSLFIALGVLPFIAAAQQPFTVDGEIKNALKSEKIYLSYSLDGKSFTDSVLLKNGKFSFNGKLTDPIKASIYRKPVTKEGRRDVLSFYLEPAKINLSSIDSLKNAFITGSPVNADNEKLKKDTKSIQDQLALVNAEFSKLTPEQRKDKTITDAIYKKYEETNKGLGPIYLDFALKNPSSFVSLNTLSQIATNESLQDDAEKAYSVLNNTVKSTKNGKDIAVYFEAVKKTKVGLQALDFTQNDVNDKPVKLSDFKGKYVLVDFWASWCGPCRQENPNVVAAYTKFKDKGFTILGVSLDQSGKKESWLKAIEDDHLSWTQVSDLKFWDNAVAKQYGIRSIPANFLIDPSGKIVAKNLRGEDLHKKLEELLDVKAK